MVYGLDRASFNQGKNAKFDFSVLEDEQPTLTARGPGAIGAGLCGCPVCKGLQRSRKSVCTGEQAHCRGGQQDMEYVVRRLTPEECELLQNFPLGWTDIGDWTDSKGKLHKGDADSPRYKALGNSIATGRGSYWEFILRRISEQIGRKAYMASLFDGIGGFPMIWNSIHGDDATLWASEIEEFPIAVTKKHFPKMQHLGDITQIDGSKVPAVDVITGGSPCQDLSVAGKRAGLAGARSGLFMEQIRIVKEMRANGADDNVGRFLVWENVTGAFSSNKGEDFRAVLEEICRVADGSITIPQPAKGKWTNNGSILGDGWSVAWTVHDAKDWCVPQRRKRVSLVADFAGECAAEILFERKGVQGHTQQGREKRQGTARDIEGCSDETGESHTTGL